MPVPQKEILGLLRDMGKGLKLEVVSLRGNLGLKELPRSILLRPHLIRLVLLRLRDMKIWF